MLNSDLSSSVVVPKKLFKNATLNKGKGIKPKDFMLNQWFIYFSTWDFENNKWKPDKYYGFIINDKELRQGDYKKRLESAEDELYVVNTLLADGINPKTKIPINPISNLSLKDIYKNKYGEAIPTYVPALKLFFAAYASDSPNKQSTLTNWRSFFNIFQKFLDMKGLLDKPISELSTTVCYEFLDTRYSTMVLDNKTGDEKRLIGALTYNNNFSWLRVFFSHFVTRKIITSNPCEKFSKKDVTTSTRFPVFSPELLKEVITKLDDEIPYLALIGRFIYYTFIRPQELSRLKVRDFVLDSNGFWVIRIRIGVGKNNKVADVNLTEPILKHIQAMHPEKYPPDYYLFGTDCKPSPHKISSYAVSIKFTNWLKLNEYDKIDNFSTYSFKHSGVVEAKKKGATNRSLMKRCRHANESTTEGYLRDLGFSPDLEKEVAQLEI